MFQWNYLQKQVSGLLSTPANLFSLENCTYTYKFKLYFRSFMCPLKTMITRPYLRILGPKKYISCPQGIVTQIFLYYSTSLGPLVFELQTDWKQGGGGGVKKHRKEASKEMTIVRQTGKSKKGQPDKKNYIKQNLKIWQATLCKSYTNRSWCCHFIKL